MALENQNFGIYQSDDQTLQITGLQDMTGATGLEWTLRASRFKTDATTPLLTKTQTGGQIAINSTPTKIDITIVHTDLATFRPGYYYHELAGTLAGKFQTFANGWITLKVALQTS